MKKELLDKAKKEKDEAVKKATDESSAKIEKYKSQVETANKEKLDAEK